MNLTRPFAERQRVLKWAVFQKFLLLFFLFSCLIVKFQTKNKFGVTEKENV